MSKLDYTLLLFAAVLLFGAFCLWFNTRIKDSHVGKRITWYFVWLSVVVMAWLLFFSFLKVGKLKGD